MTPQGQFEFLVMPFGLANAQSLCQRLMQKALAGLNPEGGPDFLSVYIDDIVIRDIGRLFMALKDGVRECGGVV